MGNEKVTEVREQLKEMYKDQLERNAAMISDATSSFLRSHFDIVEFDKEADTVDLIIIDPSEQEMKVADIVYQLSNPDNFHKLGVSNELADYIKSCFQDDLHELLRVKFGMALYQLDTIRDGMYSEAEVNNPSNYDKDDNYCGPTHNGIRISYLVWRS